MSDQESQAGKYVVHHAVQSAIGDYAKVNNYLTAQAAQSDPGTAELRRLFEQINKRLDAMEEADREMVAPAVEQTVRATADLQQGDASPEKESFLERRLKALYHMAPDIGEVIITTLASPPAGIALTIQKIARKAKAELGIS